MNQCSKTSNKVMYKCTSIKHKIWYEFREHRWREISKKLPKIIKNCEELFYDEKFEGLLDSKGKR